MSSYTRDHAHHRCTSVFAVKVYKPMPTEPNADFHSRRGTRRENILEATLGEDQDHHRR